MTDGHLTNERLSELIGCTGPGCDAHGHLNTCSHCRTELESLRESLSAFNSLGLLWTEQEAPRRIPLPLPAMERWRARSLWAIPATLAVIWAVILTVNQANRRLEVRQADAPVSYSYTMADDNQLMADINRELNSEVVVQVPISELRSRSERAQRHPASTMVN